jgi:molecular chaperone GrpE
MEEGKKKKCKAKREPKRTLIPRVRLEELEKKEKLAEEYLEDLRRLKAEFENFKKRIQREKSEFIKYANEELIRDLLPILDDFDRAIKATNNRQDFDSLLEGVKLISNQLYNVLERRGLRRYDSIGEEFDPRKHEAISQVEVENTPEGIVIEEFQKGFLLKEKIIRPAKVCVSKVCSKEAV